MAKLSASGRATGSEQLSTHLGGLHSALKMLMQRAALVLHLVEGMRSGALPRHEALLRKVGEAQSLGKAGRPPPAA